MDLASQVEPFSHAGSDIGQGDASHESGDGVPQAVNDSDQMFFSMRCSSA